MICTLVAQMKNKILMRLGLCLALAGLLLSGCKKSAESSKPAPHSVDAVMEALVVHSNMLTEAAKRKDYRYVHDYAFYLKKLVQALYSKIELDQQEQIKNLCGEIVRVSDQLDASSARKLEEPIVAGTQRLQEIMKEIEVKLKNPKQS